MSSFRVSIGVLVALALPAPLFAQAGPSPWAPLGPVEGTAPEHEAGEPVSQPLVAAEPDEKAAATEEDPSNQTLQQHKPLSGTKVGKGLWGEVTFALFTSVRYLNQHGLAPTFDDGSGTSIPLDRRDNLQFQKVMLYFKGWLGLPAFRYLTYVWTTNASMGLGAQVVVAGNLTYRIGRALTVGAGVQSLPTTRSTRQTFPYWLKQDSRTLADEYFRGSFTTGIFLAGSANDHVHYAAMLGNNLSQLGVDAGQLDMGLKTFSGALWLTTSNMKPFAGYGDFEDHESPAGMIGTAYSVSREDKESQPGTEAPDNTQLRISDGRRIFVEGVFAPGVQINRATYQMVDANLALKYRGYSLEGEAYYRHLGSFETTGPLPISHLNDYGFELQASVMLWPKTLMVYAYGSKVFGEYGNPYDLGLGLNYYPFKNRVFRGNAEAIVVDRSPVGNLSSPLAVGADGTIVVLNLELLF